MSGPTRVCFVTGTRAEFGLMRSTLRAIQALPALRLQLTVTGMHLDRAHGRTIDGIRAEGWTIDATVPWKPTSDNAALAAETGRATARLAEAFDRLKPDVVLVVGDRVEAFAAASAAHLSRRVVAHVHGGDRAEGQVDDSLRHAITKLAHVHFPATRASADRIAKLGEDRWRIHRVGAPGLDDLRTSACSIADLSSRFDGLRRHGYALLVLHATDSSGRVEFERASQTLDAIKRAGVGQVVAIYPNSDPGGREIIRCWNGRRRDIAHLLPDAPRDVFLGLMRDCAVMVGNSSAGIIEAGAFGTPVVNVGDRQRGRERGKNVVDVPFDVGRIARAVRRAVRNGRGATPDKSHPYGGGGAGKRIARVLASLDVSDPKLLRKLISY
jgi:GDP/UDP-N,N'-diacetylbacillosamine 2-epimerase (hydrolysing)